MAASIPGLFGTGFHIGFTSARLWNTYNFIAGVYAKINEGISYNNGTTFLHISGELDLAGIARMVNSNPYQPAEDIGIVNDFMMCYKTGSYMRAYDHFNRFGKRLGDYGHFKGYYGWFLDASGSVGPWAGNFSGAAYAWFEAYKGVFSYGVEGAGQGGVGVLTP